MRPRKLGGGADQIDVKASVRERDEHRCTECGMSAEEHASTYGRDLEVHRLVPGSEYTVDGCVTLCIPCHGPKPRRPFGSLPRGNRIDLLRDVVDMIQTICAHTKVSAADLLDPLVRPFVVQRYRDVAKEIGRKADEQGKKK